MASNTPLAATDLATPPLTKCVVTTLFSTKGGTGKTTISGNLAALLAGRGYKVLLIDADPQQSVSTFYNTIDPPASGGILQFVTGTLEPQACITQTAIENLDVVLGNDVDRHLSSWIRKSTNRGSAMKVAVDKLRSRYHYIIIDTQGTDGSGDSQELALRAADKVLFPIVPDAVVTRESANNGFDVLKRLAPTDPRDTFNAIPSPQVLIYKYKSNSRFHSAYRDGIRQMVGEMNKAGTASILDVEVPDSVAYNDSQSQAERMPVHLYEPRRRSADQKNPCAAESMNALADELFGLNPADSVTTPIAQTSRQPSEMAVET